MLLSHHVSQGGLTALCLTVPQRFFDYLVRPIPLDGLYSAGNPTSDVRTVFGDWEGFDACRSRIRHQAAAGSWTMPRQWEIQRTWLNSARAAVRSPAKSNGV